MKLASYKFRAVIPDAEGDPAVIPDQGVVIPDAEGDLAVIPDAEGDPHVIPDARSAIREPEVARAWIPDNACGISGTTRAVIPDAEGDPAVIPDARSAIRPSSRTPKAIREPGVARAWIPDNACGISGTTE